MMRCDVCTFSKSEVVFVSRRLVISDIHGMYSDFRHVLDVAEYNPDSDRLFLLGDYIDRGDASGATLKFVQELSKDGAIVLKGNHEDMMLRAATDRYWRTVWLSNGGDATLQSFGRTIPDWALEFISSLPLYHEEPDYILVHAGLRPGVPLKQQSSDDLLWIRDEFILHYEGKPVVFGHTPVALLHGPNTRISNPHDRRWDLWRGKDKVGIDTGAAWDGYVTLVDLDTWQIWRY